MHLLPLLTRSRSASVLADKLGEIFLSKLQDIVVDGRPVAPPKNIPWYPGELTPATVAHQLTTALTTATDNLAWEFGASRNEIRKQPVLKTFHRFLVDESEQGGISRQEAVSMIPPLLLEVQPHHKVVLTVAT